MPVRFEDDFRKDKWNFQRYFYALLGFVISAALIFLFIEQIRQMKIDDPEFSLSLLFLIHSVTGLFTLLSTSIYCSIHNAVLTTLNAVVLSVYTAVHFYLRYGIFSDRPTDEDFYWLIIRLALVMILLVLMVPWTNVLVRTRDRELHELKPISRPRASTFSWFLFLDFLSIISILVLNIGSLSKIDFEMLLRIGVALPLTFVWLGFGILLIKKKSFHSLIFLIFFILSMIEIFHWLTLSYSTIIDYRSLSSTNEWKQIRLLIIRCVGLSAHFLIHILTIIISCCLFIEQDPKVEKL